VGVEREAIRGPGYGETGGVLAANGLTELRVEDVRGDGEDEGGVRGGAGSQAGGEDGGAGRRVEEEEEGREARGHGGLVVIGAAYKAFYGEALITMHCNAELENVTGIACKTSGVVQCALCSELIEQCTYKLQH
jgi:hypothetical protein